MKLLQIVQKPQRRGAETFARQLGGSLREKGHRVRTAYLEPYPGGYSVEPPDVVLGVSASGLLEKVPGIDPWRFVALVRVVREFEPDIVQVGGGRTAKYGGALKMWFRRRSFGLVWRNIGTVQHWVRGSTRRFLYRSLLLAQMDGVVSVTQNSARDFTDFYQPKCPVEVIPTGIAPAGFDKTGTRERVRAEMGVEEVTSIMLFAGSLAPEKRVDRLLRASAVVRGELPDARLWIAGDGPLGEKLRELSIELGLGDTVTFLGSRSDIASLMAAADLLVLTSDSEGIPRVVLEAGFASLAVVVPDVGGITEFVVSGRTGVVVSPRSEQATAKALVDLLRDPDQRRRLGAALREQVEQNYAIDVVADRYLGFYRKLQPQEE